RPARYRHPQGGEPRPVSASFLLHSPSHRPAQRSIAIAAVSPDLAFQRCANAAAAIVAVAPAFVTYRVATHVSVPALNRQRDIFRAVSVRTRDDTAVIADLPNGGTQVGPAFPITPSFDALSYFVLHWKIGIHQDVSSYVSDVQPLHYDDPSASAADVVVFRLRQYKASFAADSSDAPDGKTHIVLEPYDYVKKQVAKPDNTFFLAELYVDNASGLPSEVTYTGGDDIRFTIDYGTFSGHWLVSHAHYEETLHGPLHVGRLHFSADAVYDEFGFPTTAPDPRLA
ncbi:MAG TPA: hypothetical protein VKG44_08960, partial [Candidatus Baltobacteraceae bacterium]|nr:hypothetical protein [Candidatus Baltobacteraceae bacterium]